MIHGLKLDSISYDGCLQVIGESLDVYYEYGLYYSEDDGDIWLTYSVDAGNWMGMLITFDPLTEVDLSPDVVDYCVRLIPVDDLPDDILALVR